MLYPLTEDYPICCIPAPTLISGVFVTYKLTPRSENEVSRQKRVYWYTRYDKQ
jgi:hypothetical protein